MPSRRLRSRYRQRRPRRWSSCVEIPAWRQARGTGTRLEPAPGSRRRWRRPPSRRPCPRRSPSPPRHPPPGLLNINAPAPVAATPPPGARARSASPPQHACTQQARSRFNPAGLSDAQVATAERCADQMQLGRLATAPSPSSPMGGAAHGVTGIPGRPKRAYRTDISTPSGVQILSMAAAAGVNRRSAEAPRRCPFRMQLQVQTTAGNRQERRRPGLLAVIRCSERHFLCQW